MIPVPNRLPPKVLQENVLAVRGGWIVLGRVVVYHDAIRRTEIVLKSSETMQDVGWSTEDLESLKTLLINYRKLVSETD